MRHDFLNDFNQNELRNGVNSVANFRVQTMSSYKLLKKLVPKAGVELARPYGQRILILLRGYSQHSTTRYQIVFTDVSNEIICALNSRRKLRFRPSVLGARGLASIFFVLADQSEGYIIRFLRM